MTETTYTKEYKELLKKLSEKREALSTFRFGVAGSKIKTDTDAKNVRKDIAKLLTNIQKIKYALWDIPISP